MILFITGKPGDGKSMVGTKMILKDLVEGLVHVATNVDLVLPEVCRHVAEQRGPNGAPFDLDASLTLLGDDQVPEFYRFRAGGLQLAESPDFGTEKRVDRLEFNKRMKTAFLRIKDAGEEAMKPVHYYIDETHNFFSSREWATNGRGTLYYASQHRHLHDNVFLITQVMENVEKQLRSLVSETYVCRNNIRRSVGAVKMRPVFKIMYYYGVPNGVIPPHKEEAFDLDPFDVGKCYRTTGALGVHTKPERVHNKGFLPWWSIWAGGVALVAVFYFGAMKLQAGVADKIKGTLVHVAPNVPKASSHQGGLGPSPGSGATASPIGTPAPAPWQPDAVASGTVIQNGQELAFVADDREWIPVNRHLGRGVFVLVDGRTCKLQAAKIKDIEDHLQGEGVSKSVR